MTRILLALEAPLLRLGVRSALETAAAFDVVGEAARVEEVLPAVAGQQPDVLLLDGRFQRAGQGLLRSLAEEHPRCKVLVMVDHDDDECTLRAMLARPRSWRLTEDALDRLHECCLVAFRASARGCISKMAPPERLWEAVRAVAAGGCWTPPGLTAHFVDSLHRGLNKPVSDVRLTPREIEVIGHVVEGLANKEIAARLGIREQTVKNHVARILGKLDLRSRTELAIYAVREGLA